MLASQRSAQVADHVRRHMKQPHNVGDLEFAQFKKLRVPIGDADLVKPHTVFQYGAPCRDSFLPVPADTICGTRAWSRYP